MNHRFILIASAALLLLAACKPAPHDWDGSLEKLLKSQQERFSTVMENPARHRVQILYTQIDRNAKNRPHFTEYSYRLDPGEYFYPASTVKLPVSLMALQKLRQIDRPGLDKYTTMLTDSAHTGQVRVWTDSTSETGMPSLAHYIRKVFLVSDNDAYNRLLEFCGLEYLNEGLQQKGYDHTRIVRRFYSASDREFQRRSNPIRFVKGDELIYAQPETYATRDYLWPEPILLGQGQLIGDSLVAGPMDFSTTNVLSLRDLHDMMQAVIFPEDVPEKRRFDIGDEDYLFLYQYLSQQPRETHYPDYRDYERYPDGYAKFFLYGGTEARIPAHIRIFNKIGMAYGFLTDCAYIVDFEKGVEFLLSATVHTNANGIFNDDQYEYHAVGLPFIRSLGQAIYEVEVARKREYKPDLSRFQIAYDEWD